MRKCNSKNGGAVVYVSDYKTNRYILSAGYTGCIYNRYGSISNCIIDKFQLCVGDGSAGK